MVLENVVGENDFEADVLVSRILLFFSWLVIIIQFNKYNLIFYRFMGLEDDAVHRFIRRISKPLKKSLFR